MDIFFQQISYEEVNKLRNIAIKTFRQSYEHLNSPSNFQDYISKAFTKEVLLRELQNEESFYYFIAFENDIVGYLKLNIGNSQTERFSDAYLEIERIYLDANYQRKGIGKRMIEFTFDKARELQKTKVWLGVWDENPKAILFYERMGFQSKGNHVFKFGNEAQTDIIMEMNVAVNK